MMQKNALVSFNIKKTLKPKYQAAVEVSVKDFQ